MTDSELVKTADRTAAGCEGVSRLHKPTRITRSGGDIVLDVYIRAEFGEKIPTLAWNVQQKIKTIIGEACDDKIKAININIQGVDEQKAK